MTIELSGKTVLVTGGSRGIGRGIVTTLVNAGAYVITCYKQESEAVESLSKELAAAPGRHLIVKADVSKPEDVDRLFAEIGKAAGGLHGIVNNAGVISHVPFDKLTYDEWHRVVDTNLTGPFMVVQKALPMLSSGSSIVNIGSRVATVGIPLRAHYTAAKAGLIGLTRSLMKELGPRGIRVNLIAPGVIETEEFDKGSPEEVAQIRARYSAMTGAGRLGKTSEIGEVAAFLLSDASSYITGETINVDGGI